jgi:hypothetical protein
MSPRKQERLDNKCCLKRFSTTASTSRKRQVHPSHPLATLERLISQTVQIQDIRFIELIKPR